MSLKIISLDSFAKDVKKLHKRYKNITNDLSNLRNELYKNPRGGIELGNNCYKIRLKNSSIPTGKSGGFRVIYYFLDHEQTIYLMAMYSKSDLENIKNHQLINILKSNNLI